MKYMPLPGSSASRRAASGSVVLPQTPRPAAAASPAPDAAGLVGFGADFAVEGLDDLEDGDLFRRARERVAAAHAAVAGEEAGAAQGREELLEELLGDVAACGQLFDRHRPLPGTSELRQRDDRIARLRGDRY